ncbi:peroxidase 60-like [Syzygium oleosum]|uniref:peroxidase 60-like n=1 Tax=Syzygium oleosum TaxID=219896 RepID=UPI0011D1B15C|nr:peroxidase 60-like [Syzygium oleosum]
MSRGGRLALALGLVLSTLAAPCFAALQVGYYKNKCGLVDVESVVSTIMASRFAKDPSIVAALLRLQFHDCFVMGCDASILIDGTSAEKTAGPNFSVRGYDIIDAVKAVVEAICPGVVSCADIIVMATRDAVALAKGGKYSVQSGRLDGKVSLAQNVNLPGSSMTVSQAAAAFAQKGFTISDMVVLLGGHTVGVTHCSFIQDRLYNFNGLGKPDPTMDPKLVAALRLRCPKFSTVNNPVNLDQNASSALIVDNSFYKQIFLRRGILQIDQELAVDKLSKSLAMTLANATDFSAQFGRAMVKLGTLQGRLPGEVRKSCRAVNKPR